MSKIKQQGISSTIFIFTGLLLGFVNSAVLFPKTLGIVVFGFVKWLIAIAAIFDSILGGGSTRIAVRFFPYFSHDKQSRDSFFTFILTFSLLLSLFAILILFFFEDIILSQFSSGKDISLSKTYFYLLYIFIVLRTLQQGLNGCVTALQKPRFVDLLTQVGTPLFVLSLLLLYYFRLIDRNLFLNLYVLSPLLIVVAIVMYLNRYKLASVNSFRSILNKENLKSMLKFLSFTTFSGASNIIIRRVDLLMIASFLNFTQTGIYAVFYTIASIIIIPHDGLLRISSPIIAKMWKDNDLAKIESIYKKTTLNNFIAGLLIFIGIWVNIDNFILFMGSIYSEGKYVAIIIGVIQLMNVAFGYNTIILNHSPKYYFLLISQVFTLIVTIATNYLLIPIYGILGAAIATAATLFTINMITQSFISFVFKIHPFSWNMLFALIIAGIILLINELIPTIRYHFIVDSIVRSGIVGSLYVIVVIGFKLSPDINEYLLGLYKKISKK